MIGDGRSRFGKSFLNWKIGGWIGPLALLVVIGGMVLVGKALPPGPTSLEVADRWVQNNGNLLAERMAGFVADEMGRDGEVGVLLEELGRDYLVEEVAEHVVWGFPLVAGDDYVGVVVADGFVVVPVSGAGYAGNVSARVSFELTVIGSGVVLSRVLGERSSVGVDPVSTSHVGGT